MTSRFFVAIALSANQPASARQYAGHRFLPPLAAPDYPYQYLRHTTTGPQQTRAADRVFPKQEYQATDNDISNSWRDDSKPTGGVRRHCATRPTKPACVAMPDQSRVRQHRKIKCPTTVRNISWARPARQIPAVPYRHRRRDDVVLKIPARDNAGYDSPDG